jgi:formate hydrogenlyase transcriptional activator
LYQVPRRRPVPYNSSMSDEPPEGDGRRVQQYRALLEVAESITRYGDLAELFRDLAPRLRRVVPFDFLFLLLHDPAENAMRLHLLESGRSEAVSVPHGPTPLDSPSGLVWQTQQPMVIPDYEQETRFPHMTPVWRERGIRSGGYVPLTVAGRRIGTINFARTTPGGYAADDLQFLRQVAGVVAVAVDNALNFERAQCYQRQLAGERDRLRLLLDINNAVVAHLDLRQLFQGIAAGLRRAIQQDYTSLALYDAARHGWRLHALDFPSGKGLIQEEIFTPFAGSPASQAFTSRRAVQFGPADLEALGSEVARVLLKEGLRSHCCVPLITHDRILGTLNVGRLHDAGFTAPEVELLEQVGTQIALAVDNALAFRQIAELRDKLAEEKTYLEEEIRTEHNFTEIVGASPAIQKVLRQVEIVAPGDTAVLIQGETGTGKELIARAIHNLSRRRDRTFVKINCAAIPTGLLESELFGHERGAFTGAIARKVGRFELADGGTLFLDEVGDIPPELQPKLLRVLQEQEFERLGGTQTRRVDVRLVAATNRDLQRMVAERQFRSDLYYRLNVFPLSLPPLRERPEDIPLLVRHFVQQHARRLNKTIWSIPSESMAALMRYAWPGNVRELSNFIERCVLLSSRSWLEVDVAQLPVPVGSVTNSSMTLAEAEREYILETLRQCNWVIGGPSGAAARLGMKRTTLQSKMRKLGITRPR